MSRIDVSPHSCDKWLGAAASPELVVQYRLLLSSSSFVGIPAEWICIYESKETRMRRHSTRMWTKGGSRGRASEKAKRPGDSIEPRCETALALTGGEGKQGRWVVNVAVVNVAIQQCREG